MALKFTIHLKNIKHLKDNLQKLKPLLLEAAAESLYQSAQMILSESQDEYVPRDTSTLASTGFVAAPDKTENRVSVTLGYGGPAAPYALAVHENPRAGKTGGRSPSGARYKHWAKVGGWKYLETPVKNAAGESGPIVSKLKSDIVAKLNSLG